KAFFSYSPDENSFQLGHLGANKSIISGILHIRYTEEKPVFAKKVKVSFVGKEYAFFRGTLIEEKNNNDGNDYSDGDESYANNEYDSDVSPTNPSIHTAKRKFFGTTTCLWKSQSKGSYEGVKFLDLPFKFKLPNNLPPSIVMDGGCGRIYYTLKAEISRRPLDPDSRIHKKIIKMVVPISRYTITPPPNPSKWLANDEGPAISHIVGYEVALSNTTFSPGGTIIVPVKLKFREPQVYLKKIMVGIKEYHEFRTNKYETSTKKYISQESILGNSISMTDSPDNNEISVEVKLNIPHFRNLTYSVETTYLTVMHKLKVKINMGRAPDINLSKPITIENIITHEEAFPPAPRKVEVSNVIKPRRLITKSIEPIKLPTKKNKRFSTFIPFFNKIQALDPVTQKQISMLQLQIVDAKNPNKIYNSRSLIVA
ncbi:3863_t:CDS:1, partial [Diversispora eburnea]